MKQMFNKQHKYSIRKLSIGICSAVIGFSFLSAGTAYANTEGGTGSGENTGLTQPPAGQGGDTSGSNAPGAAAGTTIAPLPESETPARSEEKNLAQGVTGVVEVPAGLQPVDLSDRNAALAHITDGNESTLWKTQWKGNTTDMYPTTVSVPLGEDAHVERVETVFEHSDLPFRFTVTVTGADGQEQEIHNAYKNYEGRLSVNRISATVPENLRDNVRKVSVRFLGRNTVERIGHYSPSPALMELKVEGYEHLADYTVVREAIGRVPDNLSGYTESSVNNLVQARNAVVLNKKRSEQSVVNGYAEGINLAIRSLTLKQPPVTYTRLTEDATTNKAQLDLLSDVNSAGNKAKIREKLVIPTDKTATIEEITPANTTDEVGQKTVLAKVKYTGIKPVTTAEGSSINNGWANLNNAHESVLSDDANTFWGSKWPDADTNGENNRETMTLTFDQPTEITHIRYRPSYVRTENGKILKGHIMYEKEDGVWERLDLKSVAPVSGGRTPIRIDGQENFYVESATDTSYHDLVTFTVEPVVAKRIRLFGTKTHHKDVPALYDKIVSVSTFYALGNHTDIIEVPVEVVDNRSEHEKYAPQAVQNKVYNLGARIAATANEDNASAKELISEADRLPQDTKFTFKDNVSPDTATATAEGINRTVTVLVTYPGDPVPDEVEVNYTVVDNRPSPVQKAEFVRGEHEIVVTLPQDARAGDNVVMLASWISVPVTVNGSGGVVPTVTITMSQNTLLREDRQFVQIERAGAISTPVYISPILGKDKYQPSVSEGSVIFTAQTEVTEEVSNQVKEAILAKVTPQKRADHSASGRVSLPADFDVAALLAAPKTETVSVTVTYADDTTDVVTVPVIVKPGRYTQLKPEATTNKAQLDLLSDINSDDNKRKLLEKLQLPDGKTAEVTLVTPKTPEANTTAEVGDKTVTAKVLYTNIPISVASVDVKSTNTDWGASNNKQHVLDENNGTYWASLWELGRNSEADREYLTLTLSEPATISEIKYQQRHSNASTNGRIRKGYIEYRLDDRDTWKKVDLTAISGGGRNEIDSEKNFLVPEATANNKVLTLTATAFKAGQIRLVGVETDGGPTGGNQMVTVATFLPVSPQVIETIDVPVEVVDNRPAHEKHAPQAVENKVYNFGAVIAEDADGDNADAKALIRDATSLPAGTKFTFKEGHRPDTTSATEGTTTRTAKVLVTYQGDATPDEVDVTYTVVDNRPAHEKHAPQAVENKVYNFGAVIAEDADGDNADAKALIRDATSLPAGTKFTFKEGHRPDTTSATEGTTTRTAKVLVTYQGDATPDEVDVTYTVVDNRPAHEKHAPQAVENKVYNFGAVIAEDADGDNADAKALIRDATSLPAGTKFTFKEGHRPDTTSATEGTTTRTAKVLVTYQGDATPDEVDVTYTVVDNRPAHEKHAPQAVENKVYNFGAVIAEDADGDNADAKALIRDATSLPAGTKFTFKEGHRPDTTSATEGTTTRTAKVLVTYQGDATPDEVDVTYTVVDNRPAHEKHAPQAVENKVYNFGAVIAEDADGDNADAKALIRDATSLPAGTKFTFKEGHRPDTTSATEGTTTRTAKVLVTYQGDATPDEVDVTYTVVDNRPAHEKHAPQAVENKVYNFGAVIAEDADGDNADAKALIRDATSLPAGTKFTFKEGHRPDTTSATEGTTTRTAKVLVTYQGDATPDEVDVTYTVVDNRPAHEKHAPQAVENKVYNFGAVIAEDADGDNADAKALIRDATSLPAGTKFTFKEGHRPDTTSATEGTTTRTAKVLVTYQGDATPDEVDVTYTVVDNRPAHEKHAPQAVENKVYNFGAVIAEDADGDNADAKALIRDATSLPAGTKFTFKEGHRPDTTSATEGTTTRTAKVLVTYQGDATPDEVDVTYTVVDNRPAHEKHAPQAVENKVYNFGAVIAEDADGDNADAKALIRDATSLPAGTKFTFKEGHRPDTTSATEGTTTRTAKVLVTYQGDATPDEVDVTYTVVDNRPAHEKHAPQAVENKVYNFGAVIAEDADGDNADAKALIRDATSLPAGTKFTFKEGHRPDTTSATEGTTTRTAKVLVTYQGDATPDEVDVTYTVTSLAQKYQPTVANDLTVKKNGQLTAEAILAKVTPQDGSNGTKAIQGDLPSTATVGTVTATVRVTYADQSVDDVSVQVTVEELDSAKYTATGGTLIRTLNQALTEDDVKAAVTVPAKAGQVTKELVGSLPSTDARGEKKATVKVTYGDQSSENVEVTVQVVDESNREDLLDLIRRQQEELNRIRHEKEEATEERNKARDEKVQAEIDKRLALAAVEIAKQEADSKVTMAKQEADSKVKIAEQEAAHAKGQADAAKKESDQAKADAEKAREDARQAKLLADNALLAHQSGLLLLVDAQRAKESALEELDQAKNDLKEAAKDVTLAKEEANKAKDALAQANRDNADQVAAAQQAQQAAEAKLQQAQDFLDEKTKAKDEADRKAVEAAKEADKLKGQVANLEAAKTTAEGAAKLAEAAKTKAEKALEEAETAQKQAEDKLKQALADKEQAERNRDNAIAQANREKEDAVARANREKETALADAKREKEDAVAQANREKEAAVAQANRERDTALADAKREKETALADAKREKEDAVAQANREKEAAVAQANRERDTALADAKREKEDAVAQANREKEAAVAQANRERDTALADAKREKEAAVAQANREKEAAVAQANRERDTTLADAKREKEAAQAELDRVQKAQADAEKRLKEAETAKTQAEQAKAQAEREKNDADTAKRLAADKAAAAERERLQAEKDLQAAQKAQAEAEKRLVAAELERAQALEAERAKAAKALEDANNKWLAAEQALATAKVAKAQVDGQLAAAEVARARAEQDRIQALDAASRAQEAAKLAQEQAEAKARAAEDALLVAKANLAIAEATKTTAENRLLILEQQRTEAQRHYEAALASAQSDKTEAERKLLAAQAAIDGIRLELTAAELAKEDAQARFVQAQTDQATAQHEKNNALAAQAEAERAKADLEAKLRDLERVKAEELAVANHEKEVALAALAAAEREAAQALAEKEAALLALAEKEDVTPTPAPEAKPETSSVPTAEPRPNSVPSTPATDENSTANPETPAPVTSDSRPVETTGSAEPVAAETPETLAASARRELIDPRTDVRVQLESGETAPITGLTVRHRETNDVATPAVLVGQDYDLFDIVPVDQNGQPVAITKPALVLLPLDAGKAVEKVFYLPEGGSPDERVFTMTTITKADGQLVPAVAFIAEHFSDYGIVYKSTVQAATPVASSAATEQPVTDQPVANKPQVTEPATTKADQPVVVARLTPRVPAAAPASATQTASSTSLPETSDSQSGVVSLGVVGLMSALGLMGLKRRHND